MPSGIISESLAYRRDLLLALVAKEFKVRYRSTVLGYVWSVLHPLAFAGVFFLLFRVIVRIKVADYPLFLVSGLFAWQWFANSVTASSGLFPANSSLIRKVRFPRHYLVVAGVSSDLIHFVISIPILALAMLPYGRYPSPAWLAYVPLLVAAQFLFTYGTALVVGTCSVFLRDLGRLVGILTLLWFYVTPVVFPPEMVPAAYQGLLYANPMAVLIMAWREVFLGGRLPPDLAAAAVGYGLAAWAAGHGVYRRLQWRLAEVV